MADNKVEVRDVEKPNKLTFTTPVGVEKWDVVSIETDPSGGIWLSAIYRDGKCIWSRGIETDGR